MGTATDGAVMRTQRDGSLASHAAHTDAARDDAIDSSTQTINQEYRPLLSNLYVRDAHKSINGSEPKRRENITNGVSGRKSENAPVKRETITADESGEFEACIFLLKISNNGGQDRNKNCPETTSRIIQPTSRNLPRATQATMNATADAIFTTENGRTSLEAYDEDNNETVSFGKFLNMADESTGPGTMSTITTVTDITSFYYTATEIVAHMST